MDTSTGVTTPVDSTVTPDPEAPLKGMPLRTRINLLGYLVTLGCSTVLGITLFLLSAQTLLQNSHDDAQGALEIIAHNTAHQLRSGDEKSLHQYFNRVGQLPGINAMVLVNTDRQPVLTYSADGHAWQPEEIINSARQQTNIPLLTHLLGEPWITFQRPLLSGHQTLGTLYMNWDLSRMQAQLRQLLSAIAAVFSITLAIIIILTRGLHRSLSAPVQELLSTTQSVSRNIGTARYARVFAADELGELTESVNAMLTRLQDQRRQLRAAQAELEQRIALRTTELENKHREAEKARKDLQLVIDQSLDLMLHLDSEGRSLMVSPSVTSILGYSQEELISIDFHSLLYSQDRAASNDQPLQVHEFLRLNGGQIHNTERRVRHLDGHWIWIEWNLILLENDQVFMVGRDIQERKKNEIELSVAHKAESIALKHTQQIVDISLDAIVTFDSTGRYLQVSRASENIFGYQPDEMRGRLFTDFIAEEEFAGTDIGGSLIEAVRESGGRLEGQVHRFRHKQGHWVWVEWNIALQENENAMYAIARDITERREYEQALINAHNEVQRVIDRSVDLIITVDTDGTLLTVNPACFRMAGYQPEELIGTNILPLVKPDDVEMGVSGLFDRMKTDGGVINGLIRRFRHKDGHWIWVEWNLVQHINDDQAIQIHGTARDITERITYEKELITAREVAEAATATKATFLANMSHEIRTPLNGVMGMLQLLSETPVDVEQASYLGTALNSSNALLDLINDILDYSKIEAGKLIIEAEPLNLLELLEDVAAIFGKPAAEKNLNLITILDPKLTTHVVGDLTRLRQVLTNLIGNAMKFTEQGEVVCRVSREHGESTDQLRIDVSDTGIGIPAAKLDTIFGSFSQADNSTTRQYGGTGLGLAISQQLVTLMDGTISVISETGQGSTFTVTLPLVNAKAPPFGHPGLQEKRVLIVARSASVRESIAVLCHRAQMQVTDLPIWQHNLPDLLVDGSAFDLVVADSEMLDDDAGAHWISQPMLPTLVIARYGQSIEGLPEQFRQIYKPINSKQLLGFSKELLNLGTVNQPDTNDLTTPLPGRVLLVEDNKINRKVATRMLEKLGMQTTVAEDGQQALDKLAKETFDLVLMDCQMPVLDGYAATGRIREQEKVSGKHQTIIALTANTEGDYRQRCLAAGMDDYLAKPYRKEALADIVNRWLIPATRACSASAPLIASR